MDLLAAGCSCSSTASSSAVGVAQRAAGGSRLAAAWQQRRRRGGASSGGSHVCRADPAGMQELLVGGAVTAATVGALMNGLKGEPEVCPSCAGSGGVKCFACEGSGKMALAVTAQKRDPLGRAASQRDCTACKGAGMLFCRNCSGSGYGKGL